MVRWFGMVFLMGMLSLGHAQERVVEDPPVRFGQFHVAYVVNDDLTSSETRLWSMKVLNDVALERSKTATISHSTSVQKVEVLQAYTQKADGRRVQVPKDNFQIQTSQGRDSGSPAFSDFSTVTVVFPDLAVGDTILLSYRITQSEPIFPGHFDAAHTFGKDTAVEDVRLSVEFPAALKVWYASRSMQQSEESLSGGRKRVLWQWSNPQAVSSGRRDFSVVNSQDLVGASFSTFENYQAIAAAYGERALPKAQVTDRVRALATEIVGSRTQPIEQARALYDWVSTKITYGGNCVGVGTVVPREVDKVLDNRMGDCKDHATLLQALLSARGIKSEQVLINAGNEFQLPVIPQVGAVNHVLNYLPDFKLYVDATAKHIPFGVLPVQLRGKPVLHVGSPREGAVTPVSVPARRQTTHSRLKLAADGSLSGAVKVQLHGDAAIDVRAWARQMSAENKTDTVREMLRGMGLNGQGRLEMPDASALTDEFELTLHVDRIDRFVSLPGPGAFHVYPLVGGTTVGRMVTPDDGEPVRHDTFCTSGIATEIYAIELPKGMKIAGLPPSKKLASKVQSYEASYTQKGQTLHIRRQLDDHTPVTVCPPSIGNEYKKLGGQVGDNLKAQVLYR
jgi:transglutaminase-like putative cysteine protease